jgi:2-polyprenyl-6-methoxyphenol hydroxylase-like FAD-dependent oxidoreductase
MIEGVKRVLVVGGGIGGMATAICLRQAGVAVDLIDLDPEWRVYGAGITITGATLRAYRQLGLLERLKQEGAVTNGTRLRHFTGPIIADLDEPSIENGLPATGGILRPVLHRIMSDEVRKTGVAVRLGITVDAIGSDSRGVDVRPRRPSLHRSGRLAGSGQQAG